MPFACVYLCLCVWITTPMYMSLFSVDTNIFFYPSTQILFQFQPVFAVCINVLLYRTFRKIWNDTNERQYLHAHFAWFIDFDACDCWFSYILVPIFLDISIGNLKSGSQEKRAQKVEKQIKIHISEYCHNKTIFCFCNYNKIKLAFAQFLLCFFFFKSSEFHRIAMLWFLWFFSAHFSK